ncbi:cytosolic sulfotransferase 5-like [Oryza brachyantha]|uniref:cytosolic sulfotransferase 5-like n=1 Tax=Oryza brachyantha TaxID=4533 RepID=UPI001ADC33D3|nr:cytosolic sulfotransferase 5-like [Oryza brachyantha]
MATSGGEPSAPVGPVPFADVDGEQLVPERRAQPEAGLGDDLADDMVSSLPSKMEVSLPMRLRLYRGFWLAEIHIPAAVAMQRRLVPRPDDVVVASLPKCGTTWLIALAFATMARRAHPPDAGAGAGHPLRRLNPHQCVPFLEGLFARGQQAKLDALPSPRLMNTHMPLAMLPSAGGGGGGCRVVYICREPKDMAVSMCHYTRRVMPRVSFAETFESYCDGAKIYGPFWDHILGYWRASSATPDTVLFLRYEELLRDPAGNVRKLAQFVGLPFSEAEEEAGMVGAIVALCSLDNMRGFEANRTGYVDAQRRIPRETLFRKGVAGDWVHHMTPEMARRLDDIVADKFGGTGLAFK